MIKRLNSINRLLNNLTRYRISDAGETSVFLLLRDVLGLRHGGHRAVSISRLLLSSALVHRLRAFEFTFGHFYVTSVCVGGVDAVAHDADDTQWQAEEKAAHDGRALEDRLRRDVTAQCPPDGLRTATPSFLSLPPDVLLALMKPRRLLQ